VKGTLGETECFEKAPHPNPLPAKSGEREKERVGAPHVLRYWPLALSLGVLINSLSLSDCGNFKLMLFGGIGVSNHFV
jgi:hypothetical protein